MDPLAVLDVVARVHAAEVAELDAQVVAGNWNGGGGQEGSQGILGAYPC